VRNFPIEGLLKIEDAKPSTYLQFSAIFLGSTAITQEFIFIINAKMRFEAEKMSQDQSMHEEEGTNDLVLRPSRQLWTIGC